MDLDVVYASILKDYPDVLTPDETAEALGVSIKSVYHLLHSSINLGDAQTPGALQAIPFIHGCAVFNLGDENHSHVFLTLCTQFRLHTPSLHFYGRI